MIPFSPRIASKLITVNEPLWIAADHHPDAPAQPLYDWLSNQGSLSQRLSTAADGDFAVELLWQGQACARSDEAAALGVAGGTTLWIREVLLWAGGQPRVFARSSATLDSLHNNGFALEQLGNRSLGELLFSQAGIARGPLQISHYPAHWLPAGFQQPGRWARRSLFQADGLQLLVCEVFLQAWQQLVTPVHSTP